MTRAKSGVSSPSFVENLYSVSPRSLAATPFLDGVMMPIAQIADDVPGKCCELRALHINRHRAERSDVAIQKCLLNQCAGLPRFAMTKLEFIEAPLS